MDDTLIRRHRSAVRVLVLDIVAAKQPVTAKQIVVEWERRLPDLGARHQAALPDMTSQILWRLENLQWVERSDQGFRLTALGARARNIGSLDR